MNTELIYTDGACSANGTKNAKGGFGLYIPKSTLFTTPIKVNRKGEHMIFKFNDIAETFYVTNIRMEGLAIVSTLALYSDMLISNTDGNDLLNRLNEISFQTDNLKVVYDTNELKSIGPTKKAIIEIVTDSLFWINVIESWMPGWIRKGIVMEKKNPDILLLLLYYTELLKQNGITVIYTHVKSHQKGKRTEHADGNDVADVLATSSVENKTNEFYIK